MNDLNKLMAALKEKAPELQLPPPSGLTLGIEYLSVVPGKEMTARLPFNSNFSNPAGIYQGGFLSAALDEVFGPLAFTTAEGPCLTLSLNVTYLKAFTPSMKDCFLKAKILKDTKQFIFMWAEITSPDGQIMAHAESHVTKVMK